MRHLSLVVVVLLLTAASVTAQTPRAPRAPAWTLEAAPVVEPMMQTAVVKPSILEFAPSPDHDAIDAGVRVVSGYDVTLAAVAPGTATRTFSLGMPTPVSGKITYSQFNTANGWLGLPAGSYTAVVTAKGPGGAASSPASDPFTVEARGPAAPGKPTFRQ